VTGRYISGLDEGGGTVLPSRFYTDLQLRLYIDAEHRFGFTLGANNLFGLSEPGCVICDVNNIDPTVHDIPPSSRKAAEGATKAVPRCSPGLLDTRWFERMWAPPGTRRRPAASSGSRMGSCLIRGASNVPATAVIASLFDHLQLSFPAGDRRSHWLTAANGSPKWPARRRGGHGPLRSNILACDAQTVIYASQQLMYRGKYLLQASEYTPLYYLLKKISTRKLGTICLCVSYLYCN
jgi:hypothetical protein